MVEQVIILPHRSEPSALRRAYDHVRVSPQYHLLNGALVSAHIAFGIATHGLWFLATPFVYPAFKSSIDKGSKNLETYYRVRDALDRRGWDERLMEPMMDYWCNRYGARKAAIDTGYRREVRIYLREHGYSGKAWLRRRLRS